MGVRDGKPKTLVYLVIYDLVAIARFRIFLQHQPQIDSVMVERIGKGQLMRLSETTSDCATMRVLAVPITGHFCFD